ncbi:MAG: aspartate aminotransferase family protein [Pseudomonadales bacterium]
MPLRALNPKDSERLPLVVGFQKIGLNKTSCTRFINAGKGIYIYDTEGREYIDATSSFYAASLGFQNVELIDAIEGQYRKLPFCVSAQQRTSDVSCELAEKLLSVLPLRGGHIVFGSSGSEAVDFLIKLLRFGAVAKGEPERKTIIGRRHSYHGGTVASASLTGGSHDEFGLPIEGFRHFSRTDYHGDRLPGESSAEYSSRLAEELEAAIAAEPVGSVAAFFAEPVSFSAGFKTPPAEYFPAVSRVLDAHGVELVADEVITGFGRTGNMFGCETFGIDSAHITVGKGITSGYFPLSACAVGDSLYALLERGSERVGTFAHASTFAAHPVGAATALKTIEIIERDGLVDHGRVMGARLLQRLLAFTDHPLVGEVRGCGLGASLDFLRRDRTDEVINDDADYLAKAVSDALFDLGVITRAAGRNIIIAPPLIIQGEEIDEIAMRVGQALDLVLRARPAKK